MEAGLKSAAMLEADNKPTALIGEKDEVRPSSAPPPTPKSVFLETFGCQMNELDSELIVGQLRALGFQFTLDWKEAAVILYNTCSVRQHAEDKVYSRLGRAGQRKNDIGNIVIGVIGCMAERDGKDLIRRYPQVDILCGPGELDKLPLLIDNAVKTNTPSIALQGSNSRRSGTLAAAEDQLELLDLSRSFNPDINQGSNHRSAYVRITRGCNKFCAYCVVPFTRGAEMHRPPDHIVDECKKLADNGVIEITLLGQTVNHYRFEHTHASIIAGITQPQKGRSYQGGYRRDPFDSDQVTTFANLLYRIHEEVPAIRRLRFVTSFPRDFGNDILEVIRDCPRICRYLHVPAQSGSNRMLETMNRGYTVEQYRDFIIRIREYLPDAQIAGDMIVGFSTETDKDFAQTVDLLKWCQYKNCFIFKYSVRPGTTAYDKLVDDVPDEIKKERNNILLRAQAEISEIIHAGQIGKTFEVFVEGISTREARRKRANLADLRRHGELASIGITVGGKNFTNSDSPSTTTTVLAEDNSDDQSPIELQLSGRTPGDLITMFDAEESQAPNLIGKIIPIKITASVPLALFGSMSQSQCSGDQ